MRMTQKIAREIHIIIIFQFLDDDGLKFGWSVDVSSVLSKKFVSSCSSVVLIKKRRKTFQNMF